MSDSAATDHPGDHTHLHGAAGPRRLIRSAHVRAPAPVGKRTTRRIDSRWPALRDAYMSIHRYALEARAASPDDYATYRACLSDTFGPEYVSHVEKWLAANGVTLTRPEPAPAR